MNTLEDLRIFLKKKFEDRAISQNALAISLGVDQGSLSRFADGKTGIAGETVFKIIEIYKNLIEDILGDEAVDQIFEGRIISAKGLEQVCKFILDSINEHRLHTPPAPIEHPPEPVSGNREYRRAETRRKR